MRKILLAILISLIGSWSAMAQYYYTEYGHNRIQYKKFDWYFYSTNNFEVYYYPGGHEYAQEALEFLEKEFNELTDILGYAPYTKTKIFIYNSVQDLQQSNIGLSDGVFTIGGQTDFVKLQLELAYPGQAYEFKQEMIYKLSKILINDMMFGGSLAEIFQNSYLLSLPDWFVGGAARYLAYGWSQEMDDQVRDYLERKQDKNSVKLSEYESELVGQSIWNYIAIKYGKSNISNILNLTRIIRNEENSVSSTLGLTFKQFLIDWQKYYQIQKDEIEQNYIRPSEDDLAAGYKNLNINLSHVKISPDGQKIAYTYHNNGRYQVNIRDIESGKEDILVKGGYRVNDQEIDLHLPLVDWQDNNMIGAVIYKRGYLYLNTYDLSTGKRIQKPLTQFRNVESFSFNDNGRLAIVSGDVDGQNDLFLVSMRRNALKRITNDQFDDVDPRFIPGTATVVFSSNRVTDSVKVKDVKLEALDDNYNLYIYNLDTTTSRFLKITNTYSVDRHPIPKSSSEIFYLSDQKGITNLYKYSFLDSTFVQISNFRYSIKDYDLSFENGDKISFLMLDNGRDKVYVDESIDLNKRIFTPQTARQRMEQAILLSKRIPREKKTELLPPPPPKEEMNKVDSLVMPDSFFFKDEVADTTKNERVNEPVKQNDQFIDTDNYVFEDEVKSNEPAVARPTFRPESFFSNYRKFERESKVVGPVPYDPRFSFKNLVTSFAIDQVRGFCVLMETEINDLLENHRLTGGILTNLDLKSGNVYAEYQYLKYWMDFHVRFSRNVYMITPSTRFLRNTNQESDLNQKYALNRIEPGVALPLTNAFRFEAAPFYTNTQFTNLNWAAVANYPTTVPLAQNSINHYVGYRAAMVFDNTIEIGFNLNQGTKALIEYESYYGVADANRNFAKLNIDLRHYQKIHKDFTFATRLFYGKSMGAAQKRLLLGGMDNWIFNTYEDQGSADPLTMSTYKDNSDFLFTQFVTSLRGFDYNELYGSDALLFNAELRLPLFRYLSNSPISSTFLRNFSVIGFYDMGAAWTGPSPFSSNSNTFTKKYVVSGSAFSAEIANFQNPWLASYGWGLRSVIMGYYVKLDFAHPIQDYKVGNSRVYFTLGLDF